MFRKGSFTDVFRRGDRAQSLRFTLYFLHKEETSRLGMSIAKELGNAVTRNRVKRVTREAFREHKGSLPPGTYFFKFKVKMVGVSNKEIAAEIAKTIKRKF